MSDEKIVESVSVSKNTASGEEKPKMENEHDEYESYNYDYDKHMYSGKSGKMRTKKEASQNTNHADTCGHTRKLVTKLHNMEHNKNHENGKK